MIYGLIGKYMLRRAIKGGMVVGDRLKVNGIVYFGREPYLIRIGNHVQLTDGVIFLNHDGSTWVVRELYPTDHLNRVGTIEILDNCFIGLRAILMPNVRIGPNSVVGAGSVVTRDVPPNTVVAGNPARAICTIEALADDTFRQVILKKGHTRTEYRDAIWERSAKSRS